MTSKPVILSIDDDPAVLSAIARDLRRRYGDDYRIMRADSGRAALDAIRELRLRNDPLALFLVDQRMPQLNGVEFLAEAIKIYPDAKRALLTAYADTDAAIQAINSVSIHYYLLKPWDPPEDKLYPVLDDLLDDWLASYRPPFEGVRIIGHRWSSEAHTLRDYLARNHVPYQYLDIELTTDARQTLEQAGRDESQLPVVLFPDGTVAENPTTTQVAEKIGLAMRPLQPFYDLAIVGGGPAGLAAAVYGASEGLRTIMIEREATGGQAGTSSRIENYLGFPQGVTGGELARRATDQARRFGVEILSPAEAVGLQVNGPYRTIQLSNGSEITCHAMVVAVGLSYTKLDIPGVDQLLGRGIYYGASLTEASACASLDVFIVGAGNSAGQAAVYLAQYARRVVIVVRGDSLGTKMSQYLVQRIENTENIEVMLESIVCGVQGDDHIEQVTIRHLRTGQDETRPGAGLFVFIGAVPSTNWLDGVVQRDSKGFIPTGPALTENGRLPKSWPLDRAPYLLESSVPGVFVVGDVRSASVKRVASAVGEGSIAVQFVHQYLSEGR